MVGGGGGGRRGGEAEYNLFYNFYHGEGRGMARLFFTPMIKWCHNLFLILGHRGFSLCIGVTVLD